MEQRRDDDRRGPRPYPQRHRHIDASGALSYTATPTPAGPAPFSPAPVGLVAVRPQTPQHRPAASRRPLHRGSTHIGLPMRVLDRRKGWEQRYLRSLLGSDLLVGAAAGVLVYMLRFGTEITPYTSTYVLLSLALPFALVTSLALTRAYDKRYLYVGTQEYDRVMRGGLWLIATAAVGSYALELPTARSYVLIALPAATGTLVLTRFVIRKSLHRRRERGECLRRTIVVGHELAIIGLHRQLCRERFHGLEVVGACVPRGSDGRVGLPVYGTFDDVAAAVRAAGADTVIVLSCPELDGHALRRMAWQLERDEIDLIVASALIDVAGGRTTIRPVDGLPMLHVEHPRLSGGSRVMKELMDRAGAALLLVMSAPLLLVIAMALRIDSSGPALFRQVRVGRDGREFVIFKFRTMYTDAEARLAELKHLNEHDGVLFKIRDDPRVTAMGKWMRRYSLDELPQLLNVLLGQMSLVGPRPPLPCEVAAYADDVRRRLAVKPGMTGLWQVSGRSDLPWEEAVRLDLRYVENWSMSMDLLILLRTLTAVARSSGAY
ncbi:sugar transferase [Catellatospora vulcania]|uniref:sugar transferase n=1 Tax=Catellatospora vulcania TaxID=1460450 RepID=UPI0012D417E9|nr:sugar transferase [Catellatospora vulcania]